MHVLAVTWDGSGNLPPFLGLTEALVAAGHRVTALAHQTQQPSFEAAGADVCSYEHAAEFNSASVDDQMTMARFTEFNILASGDVSAAVERYAPDVLVIDCMMMNSLQHAKASGRPLVALVHSAWHIFRSGLGGVFRAPNEAADLLIVASYQGFHAGEAPPNMVWVGPMRATPSGAPWPRRFPDRPLVLASLSPAHQNQGETLHNICDALSESMVEGVVTVGHSFDPAIFDAAPNVSVERMLPHELILGEADALITHAGHGTAMVGLRFGVPLLCLPGGGDQPAIAERLVALGLGKMIEKNASPKSIANAIVRILGDKVVRARSRAFARDAASHPGAELAVARIEALAGS